MTRKYTAEHIWIDAQDPDNALIGITEHAQQTLGDVVFVSLPTPGTALTQWQVAGEIESGKAAADLYTPASASVLEVNQEVLDDPSLV
ncbi:MAG: glycine cleavage system protein H, partial [Comamonas sp.]|nr:glycine cleavage system protein H [Comamonas sp.]